MNAVDYARMTLEMSKGWILGLAADMQDHPLVQPTPHGGNHPLWCIGHMAYAEANLVNVFIKGEQNPLAQWQSLFDMGSTPSANADDYPSYDELLGKFEEVRAATLAYLDGITEADLDKPSHCPEEMREWFGTVAQCLAAIPIHFAFHGGQISDARRAAGKPPLMG